MGPVSIPPAGPAAKAPLDAITLQVISDSLEAVARAMSGVVERTAVHPLFQELHDYSTGVCYFAGGEVSLVARATSLPAHIFGTLVAAEALVAEFGGDLHDGDVLMLNDPYYGGSHQADWTMVRVVDLGGGEFLFPSVRAHMSDFGGVVPGGYNPDARDIWQEGYRIPPVRLVERGVMREDLWRLVVANSRLSETLQGDLMALVAGCNVGAREIRALVGKYGPGAVSESIHHYFDYAADRFRAEVQKWPDGVYVGERLLDHDSAGNRDIRVRAAVTVAGDRLSIDLAGSDPQCPGYVNSVPGTTISNALLAVCVVLPEDVPTNSGMLRLIDVSLPEGSVVHPLPPAPVMSSTTTIGYEVADAVMKAFEQIAPERVGEPGLGYCLCTTYGHDARYDDELYYNLDFGSSLVSAGGAYGTDGWGAWPASVSALVLANVEMQELQYPTQFDQYEYADDSCGAGRWRGVPGFIMKRRIVGDHPAYVILTQEGHRHPMQGYVGGHEGASSYALVKQGSPDEQLVTESVREMEFAPGDVLYTFKGGGGGWGPPTQRDPEMVLSDVLDGLVSTDTARDVYGIALRTGSDGRLEIDEAASTQLRDALRAAEERGDA
jgi:N-methylhydantoinase B